MTAPTRTSKALAAIGDYALASGAAADREAKARTKAADKAADAIAKATDALRKAQDAYLDAETAANTERITAERAAADQLQTELQAARKALSGAVPTVAFVQDRGVWELRLQHTPGSPVFGTALRTTGEEWMCAWPGGVAHVADETAALTTLFQQYAQTYPLLQN